MKERSQNQGDENLADMQLAPDGNSHPDNTLASPPVPYEIEKKIKRELLSSGFGLPRYENYDRLPALNIQK